MLHVDIEDIALKVKQISKREFEIPSTADALKYKNLIVAIIKNQKMLIHKF